MCVLNVPQGPQQVYLEFILIAYAHEFSTGQRFVEFDALLFERHPAHDLLDDAKNRGRFEIIGRSCITRTA
jgi:hypothetical protein